MLIMLVFGYVWSWLQAIGACILAVGVRLWLKLKQSEIACRNQPTRRKTLRHQIIPFPLTPETITLIKARKIIKTL